MNIFLLGCLFLNFCFVNASYRESHILMVKEKWNDDVHEIEENIFSSATFPRDNLITYQDFPIGFLSHNKIPEEEKQAVLECLKIVKEKFGESLIESNQNHLVKTITVHNFPFTIVCLRPSCLTCKHTDSLIDLLARTKKVFDQRINSKNNESEING